MLLNHSHVVLHDWIDGLRWRPTVAGDGVAAAMEKKEGGEGRRLGWIWGRGEPGTVVDSREGGCAVVAVWEQLGIKVASATFSPPPHVLGSARAGQGQVGEASSWGRVRPERW